MKTTDVVVNKKNPAFLGSRATQELVSKNLTHLNSDSKTDKHGTMKEKAINVKLTLVIKEFLNAKQKESFEFYTMASNFLTKHLEKEKHLTLLTADDKQLVLYFKEFGTRQVEHTNSLAIEAFLWMNESNYFELNKCQSFRYFNALTKNQHQPGNNARIVDFSLLITGSINASAVNDTFANKKLMETAKLSKFL